EIVPEKRHPHGLSVSDGSEAVLRTDSIVPGRFHSCRPSLGQTTRRTASRRAAIPHTRHFRSADEYALHGREDRRARTTVLSGKQSAPACGPRGPPSRRMRKATREGFAPPGREAREERLLRHPNPAERRRSGHVLAKRARPVQVWPSNTRATPHRP